MTYSPSRGRPLLREAKSGQHRGQVLARKRPLKRARGDFVTVLKSEQPGFESGEIGEVAGRLYSFGITVAPVSAPVLSECGCFIAVLDAVPAVTEWVLAESAYAAMLRKSIGKPRILLIVRNAEELVTLRRGPSGTLFMDLFDLPPDLCDGGGILIARGSRQATPRTGLTIGDGPVTGCHLGYQRPTLPPLFQCRSRTGCTHIFRHPS